MIKGCQCVARSSESLFKRKERCWKNKVLSASKRGKSQRGNLVKFKAWYDQSIIKTTLHLGCQCVARSSQSLLNRKEKSKET